MPSPINPAILCLKSGKMYGKALHVSREKIFRKDERCVLSFLKSDFEMDFSGINEQKKIEPPVQNRIIRYSVGIELIF